MARVSIKKKQNGGAPLPKDKNIILMKLSDLDLSAFPARDAKGIKITGNITLTEGLKALGIEVTQRTISRTDNSDGPTDGKAMIQEISFEYPGDDLEVNEFLHEWLNEEILAISKDCGDGKGTRLHGTPCNPLEMKVESQDSEEGIKKTITLTSPQRGLPSAHYYGDLPELADPAAEGSEGGGL
ncbi:hypothetical protein [Roseivirga seohaensis]|uniref:hypothetical protein n=1 Tax=Roseivirga seohaensis TaxID=1914963 RepID=UPI003BABB562